MHILCRCKFWGVCSCHYVFKKKKKIIMISLCPYICRSEFRGICSCHYVSFSCRLSWFHYAHIFVGLSSGGFAAVTISLFSGRFSWFHYAHIFVGLSSGGVCSCHYILKKKRLSWFHYAHIFVGLNSGGFAAVIMSPFHEDYHESTMPIYL